MVTSLQWINFEMHFTILNQIPVGLKLIFMNLPPSLNEPYLPLVQIANGHFPRRDIKGSLAILELRMEMRRIMFTRIDANNNSKKH